jgi:PKD repeat protein
LTAAKSQSVGFRQPFTIVDLGVFTDPGFGLSEIFTYTIDWGDGSLLGSGVANIDLLGSAGVATNGSYDGSHTYANGGVYDVRLTITDDDGGTDSAMLQLTVEPGLSVEFADDQIRESDGPGATTLTVTRHSNDLSQPLVVFLDTDATGLDIPASLEILANEAAVVLTVNAVDDDILDGAQSVGITATATGFNEGSDTLVVLDHETLTLTVSAATILESGGTAATLGTVTRNNMNIGGDLEVTISIDDETEAATASSVIIPAGEPSITFPIHAIEDGLDDGPQSVAITVSANGYESALDTFVVSDTLSWHNGTLVWDVDGDNHVSPIDVLRIINDLNSLGSRELSDPEQTEVPPYLDVNDDGHVSPVDALLVINFINNGVAAPEGESLAGVRLSCHAFDAGSIEMIELRDRIQPASLSLSPASSEMRFPTM